MKIILDQDVAKLGLKGEIKNVTKGHARNFLFPSKLARPATKLNLAEIQRAQEARARIHEKKILLAEELSKKMAGKSFSMKVEVGDKGQLFQAIGPVEIAKLLTAEGFSVEKEQVMLDKSVKELGDIEVQIKLFPEIIAKIKINISAR
jgi:large subunit ribosomal protein L9